MSSSHHHLLRQSASPGVREAQRPPSQAAPSSPVDPDSSAAGATRELPGSPSTKPVLKTSGLERSSIRKDIVSLKKKSYLFIITAKIRLICKTLLT